MGRDKAKPKREKKKPKKVLKSNVRIHAYGEIDELITVIGGCREQLRNKLKQYEGLKGLFDILLRIQHELFNLGNMLATLDEDIKKGMPRIEDSHISKIENEIDYIDVFDMEAYALAKVCNHYHIPFISFKYITDNVNEHSSKDWKENYSDGIRKFKEIIGEKNDIR